MNQTTINYDVPQYIIDEVNDYIYDVKNKKNRCMKLENIKSLIGLAVLNKRITRNQVMHILNKIL